jgi:hypothetical protein
VISIVSSILRLNDADVDTTPIFLVGSLIVTLWLFALGALLLRSSRAQTTSDRGGAPDTNLDSPSPTTSQTVGHREDGFGLASGPEAALEPPELRGEVVVLAV